MEKSNPREHLSSSILSKIDSGLLKKVQTELEACPSCLHSDSGGYCGKALYGLNYPLCIRYTREDSGQRFVEKHCGDCPQVEYGCAVRESLLSDEKKVNELCVEEGLVICPGIKNSQLNDKKRRELSVLLVDFAKAL